MVQEGRLQNKGVDGYKKVNGRKRHLVVDTLGLVVGCHITAANVHDSKALEYALEKSFRDGNLKRCKKILGDMTLIILVEPELSRFRYAFILFRASIAKCRVNTSSIIKSLDPFKNAAPGFITGRILREKYMFLLESSKKALDHTVVPTIPLATHAAYDSVHL